MRMASRGFGSLILVVLALLAQAGCASYDGRGLIPGKSTESEVEALMGPSTQTRTAPDGEKVRYYSRLPYGRAIYAARFGSDGKLKTLEQRLSIEHLRRLKAGASRREEVREVLGPPYRIESLPRQDREVWTYPWQGLTNEEVLFVQFSPDGVARELFIIVDPGGIGEN